MRLKHPALAESAPDFSKRTLGIQFIFVTLMALIVHNRGWVTIRTIAQRPDVLTSSKIDRSPMETET